MKRRDFLRYGMGTLAAATVPTQAGAALLGTTPVELTTMLPRQGGALPRRVELLDDNWLFHPDKVLLQGKPVTGWEWMPGTPDQEHMMVGPDAASLSGWTATTPGVSTLQPNSYGWFRTTLPNLKGGHKVLQFSSVDDNGTVFLNGKRLMYHEGWSSPFLVDLGSAWNDHGPNVLVVLVQNVDGPGGIMGAVSLGMLPPGDDFRSPVYNDTHWRKVQLPHDYIVEGQYSKTADAGHGSLPVFPAWYRKHFYVSSDDSGKSAWLYFEGIFRSATIYLNGVKVHFQDGGYNSFHVDIAQHLRFGENNVLAIHVDPTGFEGWWYEGGGIYRHVWLNIADPVHVAPWGVYVTSEVHNVLSNPSADLTIETKIVNQSHVHTEVRASTAIVAPDGSTVGSTGGVVSLPPYSERVVYHHVTIEHAQLWSLEERHLYNAVTTIEGNGRTIDKHTQRFGVRTLRFDPDYGFFLNEKSVKLQGTCNHQDFVGVGIGMPDSILYWRMAQLKEKLGCNAIRCSHNPMSPAMYEACDELGLVVMDEIRHPGDSPAAKANVGTPYKNTAHVESMILRDRNHPSVIMWSLSNEEWAVQGDSYGAEMFSYLMDAVHKHDTTRPCTSAVNAGPGKGWLIGYGKVEDILGVNYNYEDYDYLHKQYPNKMIFGSETASDVSCRGNYVTNNTAAHITSMMSPEHSWRPLARRKFVAGGFCWTGFDYRGEPTPYGWPEINSNFGLLDMCGFPKDDAFYYRAWWKPEEPLVHIFPHWNWPGDEGKTKAVWCFSNCDEVELFLNGKSLGSQKMPEWGHVEWNDVVYTPGTLEVRGYRAGTVVATKRVATTGKPAALRLTAGRSTLNADGEDIIPVEVAVVDANGDVVPTADNLVHFNVTGAATNGGVGNGDPSCHQPNQAPYRSAFNGLCMVLVRSTHQQGVAHLTASSGGLKAATLQFEAHR